MATKAGRSGRNEKKPGSPLTEEAKEYKNKDKTLNPSFTTQAKQATKVALSSSGVWITGNGKSLRAQILSCVVRLVLKGYSGARLDENLHMIVVESGYFK